eukprot:jgi/Mesen1/8032/ME000428S07238
MASALALTSSVAASSFCGQKLKVPTSARVSQKNSVSFAGVRAKYGDDSIYFDLKDIDNTTGGWDMYGKDGQSPYNGFQSKFFETFAGPFTKRGILLKLLVVGGGGALGYSGANLGSDLLPIKVGPKQVAVPGPRGRK